MNDGNSNRTYAHLPEDLILKILDAVPDSVNKMNEMFDFQEEPRQKGIAFLRKEGFIKELKDDEYTDSIMAVDGGNIIEKMSGADILLAVAVGVEGLRDFAKTSSDGWSPEGNQYYQWQTIMPHDEATPRLCQGVMFLMELSVLSNASHDIKIMDGTHFTPLLKINSMLSAREERAGKEYADALRNFLEKTYDKVIPDVPDIIKNALSDENIVAFAKYSSSRDILDAYVKNDEIILDDKTFFTLSLEEDEYTKPLSVGQSGQEREKIWNDLHIQCNLDIDDVSMPELNKRLQDVIEPIRTRQNKTRKESEVFFTYYKPHKYGTACRIECKKSLANDGKKFERMLSSIKRQIIYPDIREPFPQYLADLMAKSVSGGLYALQDAIRLSSNLSSNGRRFDLLFPYRSK